MVPIHLEERLISGTLTGGGTYAYLRFSEYGHDFALQAGVGAFFVGALLGAYVLQLVLGTAAASRPDRTADRVFEDRDTYFPD